MTHYENLGVNSSSSEGEIKKAYLKLVLEFHPDRNPNPEATERFKSISASFAVLSNPIERAKYDEEIKNASDFDTDGFKEDFSDFKEEVKETDISVIISFEESITGRVFEIMVDTKNPCNQCKRTGVESESKCIPCSGTGSSNIFKNGTKCFSCFGSGKRITMCRICKGDRWVKIKSPIKVKIPSGISDGQTLRVKIENEILFIKVNVLKSRNPDIKRDDNNLYIRTAVPLKTMITGGIVELESPFKEKIVIHITPHAKSGSYIEVPNAGFMDLGHKNRRGNLFVRIDTEITDMTYDILEQMIKQLN